MIDATGIYPGSARKGSAHSSPRTLSTMPGS